MTPADQEWFRHAFWTVVGIMCLVVFVPVIIVFIIIAIIAFS